MYCHAHFRNCTPTVRGATAPPSLCTRLVAPVWHVHKGGVQICTASVRKYRWRKGDLVSEVHFHSSVWNPTPTVQGATGSPNLCTNAVRAPARQCKSEDCTDLYSGCTKKMFASEFSPWGGVLLCALSELYTYCTRRHRISQFVYKGCAGTCTET